MQKQRIKEEEKQIEKANKKALKMEEAMATLKYEMEQKLMESQSVGKEMENKIAKKAKAASQSKLHDYSVAGSKSEIIDHDKNSDETHSNAETNEIRYTENVDKVKTDLEQKLMDNERKIRDEMAIELEKENQFLNKR